MLESREDMMSVNRRRSLSQVVGGQTNIGTVVSALQVKLFESDMPAFMQVHALQWARKTYDSLEEFSSMHMAFNMKKVSPFCLIFFFPFIN